MLYSASLPAPVSSVCTCVWCCACMFVYGYTSVLVGHYNYSAGIEVRGQSLSCWLTLHMHGSMPVDFRGVSCFHLPSCCRNTGIIYVNNCTGFWEVLRTWTPVFTLVCQTLYPRSHLPSRRLAFACLFEWQDKSLFKLINCSWEDFYDWDTSHTVRKGVWDIPPSIKPLKRFSYRKHRLSKLLVPDIGSVVCCAKSKQTTRKRKPYLGRLFSVAGHLVLSLWASGEARLLDR